LAGKLLEITIGKRAYEAVLRGNYGLAMQALQKHGLGANESKKERLEMESERPRWPHQVP
jgi:hypothetical protein